VHVKATDKPTGTDAELPLHLPSFKSLLKQPTDRRTAHNKNYTNTNTNNKNNSNGNGSSIDGSSGLWRPAGDHCEYTAEALASCVDFRFKPLPPSSALQQQPPLTNEVNTPSNSDVTPTTKLITLAVEVCLVEAEVGGGETQHSIGGCPKFVTFKVANSPEDPQLPIDGAEEGKGEKEPSLAQHSGKRLKNAIWKVFETRAFLFFPFFFSLISRELPAALARCSVLFCSDIFYLLP
jgi:hypothetical protein